MKALTLARIVATKKGGTLVETFGNEGLNRRDDWHAR